MIANMQNQFILHTIHYTPTTHMSDINRPFVHINTLYCDANATSATRRLRTKHIGVVMCISYTKVMLCPKCGQKFKRGNIFEHHRLTMH